MTNPAGPPRVRDVAHEELSDADSAIYDHVMEVRGLETMAHMFAMMGHSPGALSAVASVGEHVRFHCVLDPVLRELVICAVAQEVDNPYEWNHHLYRLPDRERALVGTRAIEDGPAPVGPVMRFSRLVANNEAVDDALIEEIRDCLGDTGLVELTVMVGYYQLIGTFCATLRVPLEAALEAFPYNG